MSFVIDFAWTDPPDDAVAASDGAVMYVSNDPTKNATPERCQRFWAQGKPVALVWETTADRMNDGGEAGAADAGAARAQANALGFPAGYVPYFAHEPEYSDSVGPHITDYCQRAAAVLGAKPNAYSNTDCGSGMLDAGLVDKLWQTVHPSGPAADPRAVLVQRRYQTTWDESDVVGNWGGYIPGVNPAPTPAPEGRTTADQVLAVAASQNGYVEGPDNNTIFGQWYGANNAPWCAEYVSWVLYTAFHANGESSPLEGIQNDKGSAYVPYITEWARARNIWRDNPASGMLAIFDWKGTGDGDHIGVCITSGDPYDTWEGNTSPANNSNGGQVMRRSRSNSQGYSLGFVDIPYSAPTPAPAPDVPPWPGRMITLATPYQEGDDVRQWQQRMADRGWTIDVDGQYGPKSANVCRAFQADKGLEQDGVVGPVTWQAAWASPVTP